MVQIFGPPEVYRGVLWTKSGRELYIMASWYVCGEKEKGAREESCNAVFSGVSMPHDIYTLKIYRRNCLLNLQQL